MFGDVDSAYATLMSTVALLQPYKATYLAQSTRVRDTVQFSFQRGGAALLDFLQAQQDYRSVQVTYVNLDRGVSERRRAAQSGHRPRGDSMIRTMPLASPAGARAVGAAARRRLRAMAARRRSSGAPPPIIVEHEEAGGLANVDHPEQFPLVAAEKYESRPALSVTGVVTNDVSRAVPVDLAGVGPGHRLCASAWETRSRKASS